MSVFAQLDEAVTALEGALAAEAQALVEQIADGLLAAVAGKRQAMQTLDTLATPQVLQALGAQDGAATATHSQLTPANGDCDDAPKGLLARLQHCRDVNQASGGAIASARQATDLALAWLGHSNVPATYSPSGISHSGRPGRELGQA